MSLPKESAGNASAIPRLSMRSRPQSSPSLRALSPHACSQRLQQCDREYTRCPTRHEIATLRRGLSPDSPVAPHMRSDASFCAERPSQSRFGRTKGTETIPHRQACSITSYPIMYSPQHLSLFEDQSHLSVSYLRRCLGLSAGASSIFSSQSHCAVPLLWDV